MEKYDVVVIGAGNGGMTAATALAQRGMNVLMLERHNIPGGCATSFCRGRFEFEVALHQLSGVGSEEKPGPLRRALDKIDVTQDVDWVEMSDLYRFVIPGMADITLKPERAAFEEELKTQFPKEKDAISRFVDLLYAYFTEVIGVNFLNDPDVSRNKYPLIHQYAFTPAGEVLDKYFTDPILKAAISAYWGYIGLPPSRMSFTYLAMLLFAYIEFKPYHIRGGSQALSNAIVNKFLSHGGTVRFNCGAKKILVENGEIKGVITETDEHIEAKYVVSNASKVTTFVELMDQEHVPPEVFQEMKGSKVAASALVLFTGYDCTPEEIGISEGSNFIMASPDISDRAYDKLKNAGGFPEYALLTCYDVFDPQFSPEGACQTALVTGNEADYWYNIPPHQYAGEKYRCAEALLGMVEKVFPKIKTNIEEMEIATPLTHIRYLGHPGGAFYGFEQNIRDSLFMQPPRIPPIKGLYLAGAWVADGGFQPTLESGIQAAKAIFKDIESV